MNDKRGFTLIELLAVIVILAVVLIVVIPSSVEVLSGAKEKSEEAFLKNIEASVDDYLSNYAKLDNLSFSLSDICNGQCYIQKQSTSYGRDTTYAKVFKLYSFDNNQTNTNTIFDNIDYYGIMRYEDIVNPNNKDAECFSNGNFKVDIYRDSDFVYCYKINLSCVDSKVEDDGEEEDKYDIDTCPPFISNSNEGEDTEE